MKLILILICFFCLETQAKTPEEIRASVKNLISQRHPDHVDEFWNSLGPEALPVLKKMYSESTNLVEKSWLLDGLSHYDDPEVGRILESQISGENDSVMRKKMLQSLIRSQGDGSYDFVKKYLDDEDPHVRRAVGEGLKRYGGESDRVRKRLADFMQTEKTPWVKSAVEKTLTASRNLKSAESQYPEKNIATVSPTPLPQSAWVGEWKGVWITPVKNSAANLKLTLVNEKANETQQKWRIELKLPGQSKQELKESEIVMTVTPGIKVHWLEIRDKKVDAVFIAQRPVTKP